MIALPFENFKLRTALNEQEVRHRLQRTFISARFERSAEPPYEGSISGNCFKIKRQIRYTNSFLPLIEGRIEPDFQGSLIHIKMRLHLIVMILLGGFTVVLAFLALISFDLSFAGLLVLVYLMTMLLFKMETWIAKRQLRKLFEAQMIA